MTTRLIRALALALVTCLALPASAQFEGLDLGGGSKK
jgi:hypothetical protein